MVFHSFQLQLQDYGQPPDEILQACNIVILLFKRERDRALGRLLVNILKQKLHARTDSNDQQRNFF